MFPWSNLQLYFLFLFVLNGSFSPFTTLFADQSDSPGAGGVLNQLTFAQFAGSGRNSIQAIAANADGNVYVTGSTSSPDLPVKNAAQPRLGESRIMRSLDMGVTWSRVGNPAIDVQIVMADPIAPQILFAAGASGIYKTVDDGETWRISYALEKAGSGIRSLVIDPGNRLRLAASLQSGSVILSFDGGETWMPSGCPPSACGGQLSAGPGILLEVASGLRISRDWGLTFTQIGPGLVGLPSAAALDPSHPGWICTATAVGVFGRIWMTSDYGATWMEKGIPQTNFSAIENLLVDPEQPNVLFATTAGGIYKSIDSALTWTQVPIEAHLGGPSPLALLSRSCGIGGGLFAITPGPHKVVASLDLGLTWQAAQLSQITSVSAGRGCAVYVSKQITSDTFIAKLGSEGRQLWATFLGGSDRDVASALSLDAMGNVYVAGSTSSGDFPATIPRIGIKGMTNAFVAKLSANGELIYSAVIGGESFDTPSALAVDAQGCAYLVGYTSSREFPVTQGLLEATLDHGSGFIAKLGVDGTLIYARYLGIRDSSNIPATVLLEADGQVLIGGSGVLPDLPPPGDKETGYLIRLDPSLSQVTYAAYIGGTRVPAAGFPGFGSESVPIGVMGPEALATDAQGNLYVAGTTAALDFPVTSGSYTSGLRSEQCLIGNVPTSPSDIYVTKLRAGDFQPLYSALLGGHCGSQPGALLVDPTGGVTISLATLGPAFPLHNPFLAAPTCVVSSVVSKLNADGSALLFSTYLDSCGAPGIAMQPDGSLFAGVTHGDLAGVLHFSTNASPAISLDHVVNAFSGDGTGVVPGGLFALLGSNLGPLDLLDLGLNSQQDLPVQVDGTEVSFNGVPAPILQTSTGRVIAIPPLGLESFTAVQVSHNGDKSNVVIMPVKAALPGLLTREFPSLGQRAGYPDGDILNEDGTLNEAQHPAAPGSVITLFATGLGATNPLTEPGTIARSDELKPIVSVYSSWNTSGTPEAVGSVPGLVSAISQIRVKVPERMGPASPQRLPLSIVLAPPQSRFPQLLSNQVGVFIR